MSFTVQQGLWTYGPPVAPPPSAIVLEVSGAVLEWTVDEPAAAPRITVTDLDAADWLWRVIGTDAHVRLARADGADRATEVEAVVAPDVVAPLRRLALGHWMRRWWPASARDGIVALDSAVLDAELAVVTASAEEFFVEAAFDADVTSLLRSAAGLPADLREDPRVADLLDACAEIGDLPVTTAPRARWRADYALVAGGPGRGQEPAIASGVASISWSAVPPGVFDAAEDTVAWSVLSSDQPSEPLVARIRAALADPGSGHPLSEGVAVRLSSGDVAAVGQLGAGGEATVPLDLTEPAAWNHDWVSTEVRVGAGSGETREARERVRRFVRSRLSAPPEDAFVAELLAAEADY